MSPANRVGYAPARLSVSPLHAGQDSLGSLVPDGHYRSRSWLWLSFASWNGTILRSEYHTKRISGRKTVFCPFHIPHLKRDLPYLKLVLPHLKRHLSYWELRLRHLRLGQWHLKPRPSYFELHSPCSKPALPDSKRLSRQIERPSPRNEPLVQRARSGRTPSPSVAPGRW